MSVIQSVGRKLSMFRDEEPVKYRFFLSLFGSMVFWNILTGIFTGCYFDGALIGATAAFLALCKNPKNLKQQFRMTLDYSLFALFLIFIVSGAQPTDIYSLFSEGLSKGLLQSGLVMIVLSVVELSMSPSPVVKKS